jgi:hypothetical protein
MDESVVNAVGVFGLVAVGVVVAGVAMGRPGAAVVLGPLVGATFGTATYLLFRRG